MSVVIVGGNERMVCQYEDICKGFGCKAKVFAKEKGAMKKRSRCGSDDPVPQYRFHKMVSCAVEEARKNPFRYHFVTQKRLRLSRTF